GAMFSDISLVPKSMMAKAESQTKKRTLVLLAILVILPIIMLTYFKYSNISKLEDNKAKLTTDIQNAQSIKEIITEYNSVNNRLMFRQEILNSSLSSTDSFTAILSLMETIMPEDVFYLNVVNTEEGLSMNCVAKDKLTVAEFIVALKDAGFVDVFVPSLTDTTITAGDAGFVTFNVVCLYGGDTID
ncbi:MAG: hypothetical protein PF505_01625, partial [Vallitaleaceae bacterium]|nr:hypothetical protein [Vallitaleaceae bacterium]